MPKLSIYNVSLIYEPMIFCPVTVSREDAYTHARSHHSRITRIAYTVNNAVVIQLWALRIKFSSHWHCCHQSSVCYMYTYNIYEKCNTYTVFVYILWMRTRTYYKLVSLSFVIFYAYVCDYAYNAFICCHFNCPNMCMCICYWS